MIGNDSKFEPDETEVHCQMPNTRFEKKKLYFFKSETPLLDYRLFRTVRMLMRNRIPRDLSYRTTVDYDYEKANR